MQNAIASEDGFCSLFDDILLAYPAPGQPHYVTLSGDDACAWRNLPDALEYIEAQGQMLRAFIPLNNVVYLA